jgi:hypothetical protein
MSTEACPTDFRTGVVTAPIHRHHPHEGPLRVLVGKERFSQNLDHQPPAGLLR